MLGLLPEFGSFWWFVLLLVGIGLVVFFLWYRKKQKQQ